MLRKTITIEQRDCCTNLVQTLECKSWRLFGAPIWYTEQTVDLRTKPKEEMKPNTVFMQ